MRLLPVLDLMGGQVVRGIAGRRQEYRPIASRWTASCQPLDVALALREQFGFLELYLADLDAIGGAPPALATFAALRSPGFRLWVDAGVRGPADAALLADGGIESLVVGLETVRGPEVLAAICRACGDRVVFSLDLKDGSPLGEAAAWGRLDAWAIAGQVLALGVRRLIVLDLARVGMSGGTGTEDLCGRLAAAYPAVEVLAGGGVRGVADLRGLQAAGVRGVLLASALHDGRLSRQDLSDLGTPPFVGG